MADVDRVSLPPTTNAAGNSPPAVATEQSSDASNSAASNSNTNAQGTSERNIMTGKLPDDFLRLDQPQVAQAVFPNYVAAGNPFMQSYYQKGGILTVTVSQARLAKNYGLSRMDPYCRIRCGNSVYETPTAYNGAKNPRWNKTFQVPLPDGINQMYIELYDECSFSPDERIAWGLVIIKDEIIAGETVDDWYSLSGKQGDDKEGMINITLQYKVTPVPSPAPVYMQPVPMMMPYGAQMPYAYPPGMVQSVTYAQPGAAPVQQPQPQSSAQQITISDKDFKTVKDMFPDMDDDIIRSVLISSDGNVDTAVNHLLSMTTS